MTCKTAHHDLNGGKIDPLFAGFTIQVVLLAQLARAVEPAQAPFDDPPLWLHDKPTAHRAADDLNCHLQPLPEPTDHRLLVALVGPDQLEAWKAPAQPCTHIQRSFRIRERRRMHHDHHQQPERINDDVPFATGHLFFPRQTHARRRLPWF